MQLKEKLCPEIVCATSIIVVDCPASGFKVEAKGYGDQNTPTTNRTLNNATNRAT